MKKLAVIVAVLASLAFSACGGPAHPEEAEVKDTVLGSYCSATPRYRVEIKGDGRYEARRNGRGAFATGVIGEKAEGAYTLAYDDEKHTWNITLQKADKYSNPFIQCPGSTTTLWEFEKGYNKNGEFLRLNDPFDGEELTKDCGGAL